MEYVTNPIFSREERKLLDFVFSVPCADREVLLAQINSYADGDIVRDVSDFHRIMEFRPAGSLPGYAGMQTHPDLAFEVIHPGRRSPTVFTLYLRAGKPFELEIYNADSSLWISVRSPSARSTRFVTGDESGV